MNRKFTGIKDLDYKIMEDLDIRSLLNFCSTNTYISELCRNDQFWKKRFQQRIGYGNFKKDNMTWKNYYLYLLTKMKNLYGFGRPSYFRDPLINFFSNANFGEQTDEIRKIFKVAFDKKILSIRLAGKLMLIWFKSNNQTKTFKPDDNMKKYLGDALNKIENKGINMNAIPYSSIQTLIQSYIVDRNNLTSVEQDNLYSEENTIMLNILDKYLTN